MERIFSCIHHSCLQKIRVKIIELFLNEAKKIFITLLILDVVMIIASFPLNGFNLTLFLGILLGNIYTILNFALLATIVKNAVERNVKAAKRYMRTHYFIRYMIMGIIFALAFISPMINGWCVVLSVLAPKITYTSIGIYKSIFNKGGGKIEH